MLGRVAKDLVLDWLMLTLHHFVQKINSAKDQTTFAQERYLNCLAWLLAWGTQWCWSLSSDTGQSPSRFSAEAKTNAAARLSAKPLWTASVWMAQECDYPMFCGILDWKPGEHQWATTFWFEMHADCRSVRSSPGVQRSFPLRRAGASLRFLFQSRTIDVRGISTPSPASSLWQLLHPLSAHRNGPVAHLEQDERNLRFHEEQRQDGHWSPFMENYSKMLELWPSLKTNRKTYVKTPDMMGLQTFGSLDHVWEDSVGHPSWKEPLLSWRRLGKLKGV